MLIRCGDTVVLCTASVEERVPPHVKPGCGWVTAEYSMLPRANRQRSRRDVDKLKLSSRSAEIQRLIGRSLRAAVDMQLLGERTVTIDCDVLQGDGGTRTVSVTGGFVALALACQWLVKEGYIGRMPIKHYVAGVAPVSWTIRRCWICPTARTAGRRWIETAPRTSRARSLRFRAPARAGPSP